MYSEIEEFEQVIQDYFEEKAQIEKRIQKQSEELQKLDDYIENIDSILNKKREEVSFREVMIAEGSKSILEDMQNERNRVNDRFLFISERLKNITKEQSAITRKGNYITKNYLEKLSIALSMLNVTDLDSKDLKTFKASFNSEGNDLPCAILAQVFTLYAVASKHSTTVCSPIVLDAIFQQEPAEEKINKIWEYVIEHQPSNSQSILSTTAIGNRVLMER